MVLASVIHLNWTRGSSTCTFEALQEMEMEWWSGELWVKKGRWAGEAKSSRIRRNARTPN